MKVHIVMGYLKSEKEEEEFVDTQPVANEGVTNSILMISQETTFVVQKICKEATSLTRNSKGKAIVGNDSIMSSLTYVFSFINYVCLNFRIFRFL